MIIVNLALGFLAGALLTVLLTKLMLKGMAEKILRQIAAPTNFDPKQPSTSKIFPEIDLALAGYRKRIQHLIETIATLGEESQALIERYELLTNNLAAAVIVRDASGKITYASPFTEVLTGYSRSEIYGVSQDGAQDFILSIAHEEDIEQLKRSFLVSAAGEAFQYRHRFYHKSGIEMWAETRTVPVLGEEGDVITTLSITFDVTGSVRYQKQVEERNRDLQDFAYMVSHDLKAPVFTIQGMAAMLNEEHSEQLGKGGKEALEHIIQATSRLQRLIASIIEYSKAGAQVLKKEEISLNSVLKDVLDDHGEEIKRNTAIIEIDQEIGNVIGDRVKLYQVFSNLIGNALKHRSPERAPHVKINAMAAPNRRRIEISVSDNGLGIPEDKLNEVFRPFQRLNDSEREGSGVGLACVKRIVDKLGGEIRVESKPNQGSTFMVTLPIC